MKKYETPEFRIYEIGEVDVITSSAEEGGMATEKVGSDGGILD